MNAKTRKAIIALYKKGHNATEIEKILDIGVCGFSISSIEREIAVEKALEKPKTKQIVLKWTRFNKDDETTHPTHDKEVLVSFFDGYAVL